MSWQLHEEMRCMNFILNFSLVKKTKDSQKQSNETKMDIFTYKSRVFNGHLMFLIVMNDFIFIFMLSKVHIDFEWTINE